MCADRKRSGKVSATGICLLIATLFVGVAVGVMLHGLFPVVCKVASSRPANQTVSAFIQVAMNPEYIVYKEERTNIDDYKVFKNTQQGLIKTPYVFMAALRKQKISNLSIVKQESDPLAWLADELQVGYINDSEIMRVAIRSANPVEATALVDAIVDAYIEEVVNKQERERRAMATQLSQIYNSKENEVRSKRANLINLSEKLNVSNSDTAKVQSTANLQELSTLRSGLLRVQLDLGKTEAAVKAGHAKLKRLDEAAVPQAELKKLIKADPVCKKHAEMIAMLRQAVAQQKQLIMPGDKKAANARLAQQLAALEKDYETRENELRQLIKGTKRAEIEEEIAVAQVQVMILTKQIKELSSQVAAQREKVSEIGRSSVDITMMTAELESLEKVLDDIRTEREKLSIESRARPRITRQSPAQVESKRDKLSY